MQWNKMEMIIHHSLWGVSEVSQVNVVVIAMLVKIHQRVLW